MDSIEATTPGSYVVHFICDDDDREEIAAIEDDGRGSIGITDGGYAKKVNRAIGGTTDDLIFVGADDLEFQPGWFQAASELLSAQIQVVGVNDLLPRSRVHATHFLMTRSYAELPMLDGEVGPLCEEYDHSYVDDELIATASHRRAYAYASHSHVKHLHPDNGSAEMDETYRKGRARMHLDRRIFRQRSKQLWT